MDEPPEPNLRHELDVTTLAVDGTLPEALSGRLLCIGPGPLDAFDRGPEGSMVHALHLHARRAARYRRRWVRSDATALRLGVEPVPGPSPVGPDRPGDALLHFGAATYALGHGSLAYELGPELTTTRRVDLAGRRQGIAGRPHIDAPTGELHLIACGPDPAHVVISRGALTRVRRPIPVPPSPPTGLAVTATRIVLVADGAIGLATRTGELRPTWWRTELGPAQPVRADDADGDVLVDLLTPSPERWLIRPADGPQRVAWPGQTAPSWIDAGHGRVALYDHPDRTEVVVAAPAGPSPVARVVLPERLPAVDDAIWVPAAPRAI